MKEYMKNELTSREKRRRRRIKSQILAYVTLLVLIVAVLFGGYKGVGAIKHYLKSYNQKVNEAIADAESSVANELEKENQELSMETSEEYTESEVDNTSQEPLDELVNSLIQDMTIEEMVAGMFMVSPESITGVQSAVQAGESTKKAITENPVGGIIYTNNNYKSKEQFLEMLTNTRSFSKYPLFIAVTKECGEGTEYGVSATTKASELKDTDSVFSTYDTIATQLLEYGVNMNMAPVADIVSEDNAGGLEGRTFGSDAATAAPLVNAAVTAMQEKEISAVLQKFPGVEVEAKTLEELKNSEFLIYDMAIKNGVDCIMVSHVKASGVTGDDTPSSLSKIMITDVLRNTLGYQGVVITDALSDTAITDNYTEAEAAVAAILAGADMILSPNDYEKAYEGVLQAVSDGTITNERIRESIYRIYKVKYKNALKN